MLQQMQFAQSTCILNIAIPGDTVDAMSERIENWQDDFSWLVGGTDARRWDAILLSGGGNDLIRALPDLIRSNVSTDRATDYVDFVALRTLEQRIRVSFARIVQFRDCEGSVNRDVPIFVHTYDYSTPSHAPARIYDLFAVNGPWLLPRMRDVPQAVQKSLSNYLLDRVAQTLLSLQATLPNFFVIDTRGTLHSVPPETTRRRGDWDNEIHPSRAGYRKLAPLVAGAVDACLSRTFNRARLRAVPASTSDSCA
jgi:lysophospholipase L1-like esterase